MTKRPLSQFKAAALMTTLLPFFSLTALATRLDVGNPIFFRQKRYGINGEPFEIIKFRTMRDPLPHETSQDFDATRVTKVGHVLRRYGLDEFPQIINIFKGDMRIIGPRAMPEKMPPTLSEIYNYKPGIISPRAPTELRRVTPNMPDYDERIVEAINYDIEWLKNRTLLKSIKLIFDTAVTLVTQDTSGTKPQNQIKYEADAYEPPAQLP